MLYDFIDENPFFSLVLVIALLWFVRKVVRWLSPVLASYNEHQRQRKHEREELRTKKHANDKAKAEASQQKAYIKKIEAEAEEQKLKNRLIEKEIEHKQGAIDALKQQLKNNSQK